MPPSNATKDVNDLGIRSAYVSTPLSDDHFTCPICLDLYVNIVSIPCGHNYCKGCVEIYWKERNIFTCPDSALAEADKLLEESLRAIERARAEILARIEVKRKEQEDRAGEFIEKIEQDIVELEKKKKEFEKLLEAEDHISFLQV
ncbi:NF7B factor, partial [Polypterus senegalus]|nr:NF7B factor [Polypterus senegalus]